MMKSFRAGRDMNGAIYYYYFFYKPPLNPDLVELHWIKDEKTWLYHLLHSWPWASHMSSRRFSFHICKMEISYLSAPQVCFECQMWSCIREWFINYKEVLLTISDVLVHSTALLSAPPFPCSWVEPMRT